MEYSRYAPNYLAHVRTRDAIKMIIHIAGESALALEFDGRDFRRDGMKAGHCRTSPNS
jgi:hypothetical protein